MSKSTCFGSGRPAYATIAANGGLFCVAYFAERRPDGTGCSSHREGYSLDVFDEIRGSGVPLVDFRTMDFAGWRFPIVKETSLTQRPDITLAAWLDEVKARGATVTTL